MLPLSCSVIGLKERLEDEEVTDILIKGAYIPKDLNRDSDTGWSIVDDATFVTEWVEMDFSKDDAKRDPSVLLQKVQDKMLLCNTTPDDPDAIRFLTIIKNYKVSNI